jgi:hypothetical protein
VEKVPNRVDERFSNETYRYSTIREARKITTRLHVVVHHRRADVASRLLG